MSKKSDWKDRVELLAKILGMGIGSAYALGFFVWNMYVQLLGFYPDLFQGRFIATGVLCALIGVSLFGLAIVMKESVVWVLKKMGIGDKSIFAEGTELSKSARIYSVSTTSLLYLFSFSLIMFPYIDGHFGGNKPRLVSIIGKPEDVSYLVNFGVRLASDVQTQLLCVAYEDKDYMVVILSDRIMSLKKDPYTGFVSLPNKDEGGYKGECTSTIVTNLLKMRAVK